MKLYVCYTASPMGSYGHPCGVAAEAVREAGHDPEIKYALGWRVLPDVPFNMTPGRRRAKELGVRKAMPLNVGGAFHTPLMREAADALIPVLAGFALHAPEAPVVSNDDGEAHTDADGWRDRSARHVAVPVRWRDAQLTLSNLGATTFLEVGHGTMLAALAKRTVPDVTVVGVSAPDGLAELLERA